MRRPGDGPPPETDSPGSKARRLSFVPRPRTRTSKRPGFCAISIVPTWTRCRPQPTRLIRSSLPVRRTLRPPLPTTFQQARDAVVALEERERELDLDYGAWRLLQEALMEAEQEEAVHLGKALVQPVSERVTALTGGRYGQVAIGPQLEAAGIQMAGGERKFDVLSVGTQEQVALLLRLSIAEALEAFIVLDDQLTQSDPVRMTWMRDLLEAAASRIQVVVMTCHPEHYAIENGAPPRCGPVELRAAAHDCRGPADRWMSARLLPDAQPEMRGGRQTLHSEIGCRHRAVSQFDFWGSWLAIRVSLASTRAANAADT